MGWGSFTFALDWARPPRQMISTGWYYAFLLPVTLTGLTSGDGGRFPIKSSHLDGGLAGRAPSSSRFSAVGCPALPDVLRGSTQLGREAARPRAPS